MIARRALLPAALLAFGTARAAAGPARIVSVGGAITEAAFALGAGGQVAAVDTTSRFPLPVQGLPQIGYMRALAPEGLIALRPDLLLLSDEAGPVQALAVLRAAGLPIATIRDGAGPGAAEAKIRAVAAALGLAGEPVASAVAADWQALDAPIAALPRRLRALFVLAATRGAPLASGRDTHADAMLRAAGAENVLGDFAGYRPLSAEAAATLAPEVIVMMDHTIGEAGGIDALLAIPALAVTPAAATRRVVAVEGSYALGFGPRAAQARRDLTRLLHPGVALPELPARPWA
ncbi:heme/hemin ABC transporter substrate-binding protein [Plastoroseomonas hellenica]|uniref:heme/hemin ABC transporter substrate-binding protein n=1 Tax=Plastoroseomonas hellenica TaxID=2687306 RepID=UPI001BA60C51|nr:ABC transporter substrate-binding protein [Plastoroseomonas hellenica]MBR0647598.1 ABC transporter substrate-binding protein [Plastoroseomonas hellenica]